MAIASSNISAQKLFTLEDLNFGGKNYKEMTPKRLHTTWYGDQLTTYDAEHFYSIDKTSGERSVIDDPRTKRTTLEDGTQQLEWNEQSRTWAYLKDNNL